MERASGFSAAELGRGVNDEWPTVQSLRHVVLVVDLWLSRNILGGEDSFHPIALPPSFAPAKLPGSSIDPDADPSFEEAREVVRTRLGPVTDHVTRLNEDEFEWPTETHAKTVAGALDVLFKELLAHNYFMNRDLDIIEKQR